MRAYSFSNRWLRSSRGAGTWAGALLLLAAASGCSQLGDETDGFSSEEWKMIEAIQPFSTPMPRNPFNHKDQDDKVAKLGQALFFMTELADAITVAGPSGMVGEKGKIGCVTCHDPGHGWADGRPGPQSHGRTGFLRRNTPTTANVGWYEWAGWTGRHDSLVMHGSGVMGTQATPLAIAHYLFTKYRTEYDEAFPETPLDPGLDDFTRFPAIGGPKANAMAADGPWEKMPGGAADWAIIWQVQANIGRIWDTYPRKLVNANSPFEVYVRERDFAALSPEAKNGLRLFIGKAACNDCHNGPILSDNKWHNIGVPEPTTATTPDLGRFADMPGTLTNRFNGASIYSDDPEAGKAKHMTMPIGDEKMRGAFRTPMLVNIAQTGPYFHTGLAPTLRDVVVHYNKGGGEVGTFSGEKDPRLKPLGLTETEIEHLVEFLKSLTGEPVDPQWTANITKP
jgi:cytochrome c peroxidase